jgi:hypothetical protein
VVDDLEKKKKRGQEERFYMELDGKSGGYGLEHPVADYIHLGPKRSSRFVDIGYIRRLEHLETAPTLDHDP